MVVFVLVSCWDWERIDKLGLTVNIKKEESRDSSFCLGSDEEDGGDQMVPGFGDSFESG